MLNSLKIQNIALIDELEVNFYEGLNIITGETGAGKSVLINALCFALGARADKTLIRNGKDFAKVEAVFDGISSKTRDILLSFDIDCEENKIIISRKMLIEGKNDIKINGVSSTLAMLKSITQTLVDVYGQFEHSALLDVNKHIELLDLFIGKDIIKLLEAYNFELDKLQELNKIKIKLGGNESERKQKIDYLNFQIKELTDANLIIGEEENLKKDFAVMNNIEKIKSVYSNALNVLSGESGALNQINSALKSLQTIENLNSDIIELDNRLDSARIEIDDIINSVQILNNSSEFDSEQYLKTEKRLDEIHFLCKKYNKSSDELIEYLQELSSEYELLINSEEKIKELEKEIQNEQSIVCGCADKITELRKEYARKFEIKLMENLRDLGMKNSSIVIDFIKSNEFTKNGNDNVEFLFSANLGEPPKPLTKIISGGEMSRFCLAYKCVINENSDEFTMIFDEIDTGVSGEMGQEIAKKLATLSRKNQVLCISHLPQIASMADYHYKLHKDNIQGKTISSISLINEDERLKEIARLSGGENISQFSLMHAKDIRSWAIQQKENLK